MCKFVRFKQKSKTSPKSREKEDGCKQNSMTKRELRDDLHGDQKQKDKLQTSQENELNTKTTEEENMQQSYKTVRSLFDCPPGHIVETCVNDEFDSHASSYSNTKLESSSLKLDSSDKHTIYTNDQKMDVNESELDTSQSGGEPDFNSGDSSYREIAQPLNKCFVSLKRCPSSKDNMFLDNSEHSTPEKKQKVSSESEKRSKKLTNVSRQSSDSGSSICDLPYHVSVKCKKSSDERVAMIYDANIDVRKSGRLKSAKCASRYRGDYGIRADTYNKIQCRKVEIDTEKHSLEENDSAAVSKTTSLIPMKEESNLISHPEGSEDCCVDKDANQVIICEQINTNSAMNIVPIEPKVETNSDWSSSLIESSGILEQNLQVPCSELNVNSESVCNSDCTVDSCRSNLLKSLQISAKSENYVEVDLTQEDDSQDSLQSVLGRAGYVHSVGRSVNKKQKYISRRSASCESNEKDMNNPLSPVSSPENCDPGQLLEKLRCKMFEEVGLSAQVKDEQPKQFESKLISSKLKKTLLDSGQVTHTVNSGSSEQAAIPSSFHSFVDFNRSPPRCSTPTNVSSTSTVSILDEVAEKLNSMHKAKRKSEGKQSKPKRQRFQEKKFMLRSMVKDRKILYSHHLGDSRSSLLEEDSSSAVGETTDSDIFSNTCDDTDMKSIDDSFNDSQKSDYIGVKKEVKVDKTKAKIIGKSERALKQNICDILETNIVKKKPKSVKCQACCQTFRSKEVMRKHYPCRVRQTRTWSQNKLRPNRVFRNDTFSKKKVNNLNSKLSKSGKQNKARPQLLTPRKTKFRRVKGKRRRRLYHLIQDSMSKRQIMDWPHLNVLYTHLSFKEQCLYRLGLFCVGNKSEGLENYSEEDLVIFKEHQDKEKEFYFSRNFKHIFPSSDDESRDSISDSKEVCDTFNNVPSANDTTEFSESLNTCEEASFSKSQSSKKDYRFEDKENFTDSQFATQFCELSKTGNNLSSTIEPSGLSITSRLGVNSDFEEGKDKHVIEEATLEHFVCKVTQHSNGDVVDKNIVCPKDHLSSTTLQSNNIHRDTHEKQIHLPDQIDSSLSVIPNAVNGIKLNVETSGIKLNAETSMVSKGNLSEEKPFPFSPIMQLSEHMGEHLKYLKNQENDEHSEVEKGVLEHEASKQQNEVTPKIDSEHRVINVSKLNINSDAESDLRLSTFCNIETQADSVDTGLSYINGDISCQTDKEINKEYLNSEIKGLPVEENQTHSKKIVESDLDREIDALKTTEIRSKFKQSIAASSNLVNCYHDEISPKISQDSKEFRHAGNKEPVSSAIKNDESKSSGKDSVETDSNNSLVHDTSSPVRDKNDDSLTSSPEVAAHEFIEKFFQISEKIEAYMHCTITNDNQKTNSEDKDLLCSKQKVGSNLKEGLDQKETSDDIKIGSKDCSEDNIEKFFEFSEKLEAYIHHSASQTSTNSFAHQTSGYSVKDENNPQNNEIFWATKYIPEIDDSNSSTSKEKGNSIQISDVEMTFQDGSLKEYDVEESDLVKGVKGKVTGEDVEENVLRTTELMSDHHISSPTSENCYTDVSCELSLHDKSVVPNKYGSNTKSSNENKFLHLVTNKINKENDTTIVKEINEQKENCMKNKVEYESKQNEIIPQTDIFTFTREEYRHKTESTLHLDHEQSAASQDSLFIQVNTEDNLDKKDESRSTLQVNQALKKGFEEIYKKVHPAGDESDFNEELNSDIENLDHYEANNFKQDFETEKMEKVCLNKLNVGDRKIECVDLKTNKYTDILHMETLRITSSTDMNSLNKARTKETPVVDDYMDTCVSLEEDINEQNIANVLHENKKLTVEQEGHLNSFNESCVISSDENSDDNNVNVSQEDKDSLEKVSMTEVDTKYIKSNLPLSDGNGGVDENESVEASDSLTPISSSPKTKLCSPKSPAVIKYRINGVYFSENLETGVKEVITDEFCVTDINIESSQESEVSRDEDGYLLENADINNETIEYSSDSKASNCKTLEMHPIDILENEERNASTNTIIESDNWIESSLSEEDLIDANSISTTIHEEKLMDKESMLNSYSISELESDGELRKNELKKNIEIPKVYDDDSLASLDSNDEKDKSIEISLSEEDLKDANSISTTVHEEKLMDDERRLKSNSISELESDGEHSKNELKKIIENPKFYDDGSLASLDSNDEEEKENINLDKKQNELTNSPVEEIEVMRSGFVNKSLGISRIEEINTERLSLDREQSKGLFQKIGEEVDIDILIPEPPPILEKEVEHDSPVKSITEQSEASITSESGPPILEPVKRPRVERHFLDIIGEICEKKTDKDVKISQTSKLVNGTKESSDLRNNLPTNDLQGSRNIQENGCEHSSDNTLADNSTDLSCKDDIGRHFSDVIDASCSEIPKITEMQMLFEKSEKGDVTLAQIRSLLSPNSKKGIEIPKDSLLKIKSGVECIVSKVKLPTKKDPAWLKRDPLLNYKSKGDTDLESEDVVLDSPDDKEHKVFEEEQNLVVEQTSTNYNSDSTPGSITDSILQMLTSLEDKGSFAENMTNLLHILAENLGFSRGNSELTEEYLNNKGIESDIVSNNRLSLDDFEGQLQEIGDEPPPLDEISFDVGSSPLQEVYDDETNNCIQMDGFDQYINTDEQPDFKDGESEEKINLHCDEESVIDVSSKSESDERKVNEAKQNSKIYTIFKSITELNSIETDDDSECEEMFDVAIMSQRMSELKSISKDAVESDVNSEVFSDDEISSEEDFKINRGKDESKSYLNAGESDLPQKSKKDYQKDENYSLQAMPNKDLTPEESHEIDFCNKNQTPYLSFKKELEIDKSKDLYTNLITEPSDVETVSLYESDHAIQYDSNIQNDAHLIYEDYQNSSGRDKVSYGISEQPPNENNGIQETRLLCDNFDKIVERTSEKDLNLSSFSENKELEEESRNKVKENIPSQSDFSEENRSYVDEENINDKCLLSSNTKNEEGTPEKQPQININDIQKTNNDNHHQEQTSQENLFSQDENATMKTNTSYKECVSNEKVLDEDLDDAKVDIVFNEILEKSQRNKMENEENDAYSENEHEEFSDYLDQEEFDKNQGQEHDSDDSKKQLKEMQVNIIKKDHAAVISLKSFKDLNSDNEDMGKDSVMCNREQCDEDEVNKQTADSDASAFVKESDLIAFEIDKEYFSGNKAYMKPGLDHLSSPECNEEIEVKYGHDTNTGSVKKDNNTFDKTPLENQEKSSKVIEEDKEIPNDKENDDFEKENSEQICERTCLELCSGTEEINKEKNGSSQEEKIDQSPSYKNSMFKIGSNSWNCCQDSTSSTEVDLVRDSAPDTQNIDGSKSHEEMTQKTNICCLKHGDSDSEALDNTNIFDVDSLLNSKESAIESIKENTTNNNNFVPSNDISTQNDATENTEPDKGNFELKLKSTKEMPSEDIMDDQIPISYVATQHEGNKVDSQDDFLNSINNEITKENENLTDEIEDAKKQILECELKGNQRNISIAEGKVEEIMPTVEESLVMIQSQTQNQAQKDNIDEDINENSYDNSQRGLDQTSLNTKESDPSICLKEYIGFDEESNDTVVYENEASNVTDRNKPSSEAFYKEQSLRNDDASHSWDFGGFCETIAEKVKRKQKERLIKMDQARSRYRGLYSQPNSTDRRKEFSVFRKTMLQTKADRNKKRSLNLDDDNQENNKRPRSTSVPKDMYIPPCSVVLDQIINDMTEKKVPQPYDVKPCSVKLERLDQETVERYTEKVKTVTDLPISRPPIRFKISLKNLCVKPCSPRPSYISDAASGNSSGMEESESEYSDEMSEKDSVCIENNEWIQSAQYKVYEIKNSPRAFHRSLEEHRPIKIKVKSVTTDVSEGDVTEKILDETVNENVKRSLFSAFDDVLLKQLPSPLSEINENGFPQDIDTKESPVKADWIKELRLSDSDSTDIESDKEEVINKIVTRLFSTDTTHPEIPGKATVIENSSVKIAAEKGPCIDKISTEQVVHLEAADQSKTKSVESQDQMKNYVVDDQKVIMKEHKDQLEETIVPSESDPFFTQEKSSDKKEKPTANVCDKDEGNLPDDYVECFDKMTERVNSEPIQTDIDLQSDRKLSNYVESDIHMPERYTKKSSENTQETNAIEACQAADITHCTGNDNDDSLVDREKGFTPDKAESTKDLTDSDVETETKNSEKNKITDDCKRHLQSDINDGLCPSEVVKDFDEGDAAEIMLNTELKEMFIEKSPSTDAEKTRLNASKIHKDCKVNEQSYDFVEKETGKKWDITESSIINVQVEGDKLEIANTTYISNFDLNVKEHTTEGISNQQSYDGNTSEKAENNCQGIELNESTDFQEELSDDDQNELTDDEQNYVLDEKNTLLEEKLTELPEGEKTEVHEDKQTDITGCEQNELSVYEHNRLPEDKLKNEVHVYEQKKLPIDGEQPVNEQFHIQDIDGSELNDSEKIENFEDEHIELPVDGKRDLSDNNQTYLPDGEHNELNDVINEISDSEPKEKHAAQKKLQDKEQIELPNNEYIELSVNAQTILHDDKHNELYDELKGSPVDGQDKPLVDKQTYLPNGEQIELHVTNKELHDSKQNDKLEESQEEKQDDKEIDLSINEQNKPLIIEKSNLLEVEHNEFQVEKNEFPYDEQIKNDVAKKESPNGMQNDSPKDNHNDLPGDEQNRIIDNTEVIKQPNEIKQALYSEDMCSERANDLAVLSLEDEHFDKSYIPDIAIEEGDEIIYYAVEVNDDYETNEAISSIEQCEQESIIPGCEQVATLETCEVQTSIVESLAVEGYEITVGNMCETVMDISEGNEILGHEEIIPGNEVEACSSEMTDISCVAIVETQNRFLCGINEDSQSSQELIEECVMDFSEVQIQNDL